MMAASLKDTSVRPTGLTPQLMLGIFIVQSKFDERGVPFVVTSLNDGDHKATSARHPRSLHYEGRAADIRLPSRYTNDAATDSAMLLTLRGALGRDYDVILEADHFHLEYDPKDGPDDAA